MKIYTWNHSSVRYDESYIEAFHYSNVGHGWTSVSTWSDCDRRQVMASAIERHSGSVASMRPPYRFGLGS